MSHKAYPVEIALQSKPSSDPVETAKASRALISMAGDDIAYAYDGIENMGGRVVGEHVIPIPEPESDYMGRSVLFLIAKFED